MRRQQYRGVRSAGRRHDGSARRQDPQLRGISDRRQPRRARGAVRADHPAADRGVAMSFRVRPATGKDFRAIYEMAKLTGGGFTNLPPDRATLVAKLARSDASFARAADEQAADLYIFVLEDPKSREIRGTCQVFGQIGVVQPFYSYHLS